MTKQKTFFKALVIMLAGASMVLSCAKEYDDTAIWNKVNDLDRRVTKLEGLLETMNDDINSLRILLNAKQGGLNITNVNKTTSGYQITFSDGTVINLKNGSDGVTPTIGSDGFWYIGTQNTGIKAVGADGQSPYIGTNGNWWIGMNDTGISASGGSGSDTAVSVPVIGVAEYQGAYYWTQTIGGVTTWLTDKNGNKLPVTSSFTPMIQVNVQGYWVISYDGGITWEIIVDSNGNGIKAATGDGGNCHCESFFTSVSYSNGILTLVLVDGTVIQIPCEANTDLRYDLIIPENLRDQIETFMPIYTGVTPPNVEGVFYINPATVVFCSDYGNGGYAPGEERNSVVVRLTNQMSPINTIEIEQYEVGVGSSGLQSVYISGSNNNFTVYYSYQSVNKGVTATLAVVISGTKTNTGIKNCHYALSMIEKSDDPGRVFMSTNAYRVFRDGDGMSEYTTWPSTTRISSENNYKWLSGSSVNQ